MASCPDDDVPLLYKIAPGTMLVGPDPAHYITLETKQGRTLYVESIVTTGMGLSIHINGKAYAFFAVSGGDYCGRVDGRKGGKLTDEATLPKATVGTLYAAEVVRPLKALELGHVSIAYSGPGRGHHTRVGSKVEAVFLSLHKRRKTMAVTAPTAVYGPVTNDVTKSVQKVTLISSRAASVHNVEAVKFNPAYPALVPVETWRSKEISRDDAHVLYPRKRSVKELEAAIGVFIVD